MKTISVCVPTLKRYDLLAKLLLSLRESTLPVNNIFIIDNGRNRERVREAIDSAQGRVELITPPVPWGVAQSWNWFLRNIPEERIITNDDITFAPESIERLVSMKGDIVYARDIGFSCFVLRDSCIKAVGYFDENISPGYAYYEDEDYATRMIIAGISAMDVETGAVHARSSTLAVATKAEEEEHNRRFHIARCHYMDKWGGLPEVVKPAMHEKYQQPT